MSFTEPIHVWVVDDDPLQVLVLNRLIANVEAIKKVTFFSGGKALVDALNTHKNNAAELPDIVFLDLIMMKGDGWIFLDQYKKIKSKLPKEAKIVVISSFNEENFRRLQQYPEVVSSLSKPVDKREFEVLMDRIIPKENALEHLE